MTYAWSSQALNRLQELMAVGESAIVVRINSICRCKLRLDWQTQRGIADTREWTWSNRQHWQLPWDTDCTLLVYWAAAAETARIYPIRQEKSFIGSSRSFVESRAVSAGMRLFRSHSLGACQSAVCLSVAFWLFLCDVIFVMGQYSCVCTYVKSMHMIWCNVHV
jgi:hypothetical protein